VPEIHVAPLADFGPGSVKIVTVGWTSIGVYNCGGELFALEDRCSHDDGPLCEGEWEEGSCRVICPRHGSAFDLRTGRPLSLPAFEPVDTYEVVVRDGVVMVVVADVHP
jgi:3-phenylpropionate/trans-cinnamate dioxygenase ferredoxin component